MTDLDAAAGLATRERVLLFCAASGTDWQHASIPGETVTAMMASSTAILRPDRADRLRPRRAAGDAGRAMTTPPRFPAPWRVTELPGGYAVAVVPQKPDPLRAGHAEFSHGPILLQKSAGWVGPIFSGPWRRPSKKRVGVHSNGRSRHQGIPQRRDDASQLRFRFAPTLASIFVAPDFRLLQQNRP
jgi:hypothetical protein